MIKHALCISVLRHDMLRRAKISRMSVFQPDGVERDHRRDHDVHLHTKARICDVPMVAGLFVDGVVVDQISRFDFRS